MPINFNNASSAVSGIAFNGNSLTNLMFNGQEVLRVITGISVSTTKTEYYVGDSIDTSKITVIANYTTGNSVTVSSDDYTVSPAKLNSSGNKEITVSYSGKSATFTVSVAADNISSIQVISNPTNTEYTIPYGSSSVSLNTAGLKLKATYDSGKTKTDITSGFTCSPTTFSAYNPTQTVTVTYGGKTATFTVNVDKEISYTFPNVRTSNLVSSLDFLGFAISAVDRDSGSPHVLINGNSQDGNNVQIKANYKLDDGYSGGYVVVKVPTVWGIVNLQSVTIYGASNFEYAMMSYSSDRDQTITNTYQQNMEGTIFSGKTPANINAIHTVNANAALIKIAFTKSSANSNNIVIGSEYVFNVVIAQSKLVKWGRDSNYT